MTETTILAAYGLLVVVTLVLQATGSFTQLGMGYLLGTRDEGRTVTGMTGRLDRALSNSVTAMALFAPAILLHVLQGTTSDQTLLLAQAFLIGRVVYLPAYVFGINGVRTAAWALGFISTAILYLLKAGETSHWHRVDADEIWHFHAGAPLDLRMAETSDGAARAHVLGPDVIAGQSPQLTVPAHHWQSARSTGDWTLVSCTVCPGFRFDGFTLAPPDFDIPSA